MDAFVLPMMSFCAGTLALLCVAILWLADGQQVQLAPVQQAATFGSVLDVLHIEKVPEREAAQLIRRAARLGYQDVMHMYDQVGSIYIVFQLCPKRALA